MCKRLHKNIKKIFMNSLIFFCISNNVLAMPQDAQVVSGDAIIVSQGQKMDIRQLTDKVILDWQKFGIGANEWVNFLQPNANSIALNRVVGLEPSQIFGRMTANGQIFLINQNGILFAPSAQIDVGGLLASTMNISNQNFLKGDYIFEHYGNDFAKIENKGILSAKEKGYIALLAPNIVNEGVIRANMGKVLLFGSEKVVIDFDGDGLLSYAIEPAKIKTSIINKSLVEADGGLVYMSTGLGKEIKDSLITNEGVISAQKIQEKDGKIYLVSAGKALNTEDGKINAGGGTINLEVKDILENRGTIDVSCKNGKGGNIYLLGSKIGFWEGLLDASGALGGGKVRIGGGWQGGENLKTAHTTLMGKNALVDVSAKQMGDGGSVVLWSDYYTGFFGKILARSGVLNGNGGVVETSGKNNLQAMGKVDAKSINGKAGLWLLDPYNVTISNNPTSNIAGDPTWIPTDNDANILNTEINDALDLGTSVSVTTAGAGAQDGNITVNATISKTGGTDATLILKANKDIIVNESITSVSDKLNIILNSDTDKNNSGGIRIGAGVSLFSNGGNIILGGGDCDIDSSSHPARGTGAVATAGIDMAGTEGSLITINSNGGNIWLWGYGPVAGGRGVQIKNTNINAGSVGKIEIRGDGFYKLVDDGHGVGFCLEGSNIVAGSGGLKVTANGNFNNTGQWTVALNGENTSFYTVNGGTLSVYVNIDLLNGNNRYVLGNNFVWGHDTLQNGNFNINFTGTAEGNNILPIIKIPSGNLTVNANQNVMQNGKGNLRELHLSQSKPIKQCNFFGQSQISNFFV